MVTGWLDAPLYTQTLPTHPERVEASLKVLGLRPVCSEEDAAVTAYTGGEGEDRL